MDLRMYILMNKDIELSKGKTCGQASHSVASYFYNRYDKELITNYMENQQKNIILACPQVKLEELESQGYISIRDNGLTELEPNTLTCVNLGIFDADKEEIPKWVKRLYK